MCVTIGYLSSSSSELSFCVFGFIINAVGLLMNGWITRVLLLLYI